MDMIKAALRLVEKSKNAVVASVDGEGYPNMKVMFNNREREGVRTFYFTTNTSSRRVSQFRENPRACLYFYDPRFYRGLMIKGRMEVLEDSASKEKLWRTGDEMYYPQGVTDPDYCVLKFTAEGGRYYEGFHSTDFPIE
jgi:general stress protein 26